MKRKHDKWKRSNNNALFKVMVIDSYILTHLSCKVWLPSQLNFVSSAACQRSIGPHDRKFGSAVETMCVPSTGISEIWTIQSLLNTAAGVILTRQDLVTCLFISLGVCHCQEEKPPCRLDWPLWSLGDQCVLKTDDLLLVVRNINGFTGFQKLMMHHILLIPPNTKNSLLSIAAS
ncbi:hypothetical protein AVEN_49665-1 [Araneus ventricosus]|uniref:Uncharacterized protein n=1 Tax=Araneus ventricosus TaxID=182803 RepID=A0A4Y2JMT9_ARAVE|nr:hypothetical protein AVEN_49665-1 [Araneus ventricosus]